MEVKKLIHGDDGSWLSGKPKLCGKQLIMTKTNVRDFCLKSLE